ncbi:hypothetical protein FDA09_17050 [Clostridium botulinum]|uniref:hypothetical protein n=1 Tax=Clostridium botulinum TaxID=1491 RepID=UPI0007730D10|nr:hypothetical protein [Clostridium botulinum]NFH81804.1 hypothetical protein [Clostridium botulinum]NFH85074.1 hypothetical protein [Clostridium botulinum]NFI13043.1 hypothetical protein [Clostridium botulinum]NFI16309.1 hypothetical protein [Clostridium botulinum]NFO86065.1 hypothetical protein [Clostridium botulinum]
MGIKISNIKRVINKNGKMICPNEQCCSENIVKDNINIPEFIEEIKDDKKIMNYNMYCNKCEQEFMIEVINDSNDDKRISELLSNLSCKSDTI